MTEPIVFDEFFDSGMAETVSPFLKPESRRWGKNLSLKAALLSTVLLAIAFGISFHPALMPLSSLLLVFVYVFAGVPKLIDAFNDILSLEINIDVLMTLAAFLSVLIGSAMEGALLLVLFAVSGAMEQTVTYKAQSAVRSLHKLAPTKALMIDADGKVHERHVRDVPVKSRILVRAGEIVPLDGKVVEGSSSVNLAHLTGESLPVQKIVGDVVPSGGTNMEGALVIEVSHASSDSTLSRIIKLVTQAQEAKPRFQRWLDKVGRRYSVSIIGLSFLFAVGLPWVTQLPYLGYEGSVYRALAFLIAASPCALIIALPVAYLSSISACARRGILLKGGITLDALASCRAIAFDKTGTLTTGELTCLSFTGAGDLKRALGIARALEQKAVHPIAKAVLSYADEQAAPKLYVENFRALPGYGLEGTVDGEKVYIGHPAYAKREVERAEGELVALLVVGKEEYLFRFADELRPEMRQTIETLRRETKLESLMLTGDHEANAKGVAESVGIERCYADLRPEDKLEHVTRLSNAEGLAMVGDGINDAPALARATVGISMGRVGSRTAVDASDVVLLQDDINLLGWLWRKARATQHVVRQNVALASIAIVVASLSALFGIIPLWLAVVLHEGGTVLVGLNSLRLLRK